MVYGAAMVYGISILKIFEFKCIFIYYILYLVCLCLWRIVRKVHRIWCLNHCTESWERETLIMLKK